MVWKAAGKFKQMITAMSPEEVIDVLINALDQRDINLALKTLHKPDDAQREQLENILSQVSRIKVQRIRSEGGQPETFWVYLTIRYENSESDIEKRLDLQVIDEGSTGHRILSKGLEEILNRKASVEITDTRIFDDYDMCD
jgi:hypothetical protein